MVLQGGRRSRSGTLPTDDVVHDAAVRGLLMPQGCRHQSAPDCFACGGVAAVGIRVAGTSQQPNCFGMLQGAHSHRHATEWD